jgi:SAM-dependent methyltransferase
LNYDEGDLHLRYDSARALPRETVALWMEILKRHLATRSIEVLVDVGCGTGRFTCALAENFVANVYGVDPSRKMLGVAKEACAKSPARSRVNFILGAAEEIPLGEPLADIVFLSMSYHHIRDKRKACAEFKRILKPEGRVMVRTATRERLDSYLWLSFFPEAVEIERRRTPSGAELSAQLEACGFKLEARESVRQLFAAGLREYAAKIGLRGLSSLRAIDDEAFAHGLSRLRDHCEAHDEGQPVYEEIDLFTFSLA